MGLIIKSVNLTEETKIVKSINWEYGLVSGTQEVPDPNPSEFIKFEKLTNDIVKDWLLKIKDFTGYDEITEVIEIDKIITLGI